MTPTEKERLEEIQNDIRSDRKYHPNSTMMVYLHEDIEFMLSLLKSQEKMLKIAKTALEKINNNEMPTDLDEEPYIMASEALALLQ